MAALRGFEQVTGLVPGQHVAWAYADRAELGQVLADFLAEGHRRNEQLRLLGTATRAELLVLLDGLPARDELLEAGQLEVASLQRADGSFVLADPTAQVAAVAAGVAAAVSQGWSGQRVAVLNTEVGEWTLEQRARLEAYELAVDALFDRLPLTALCLYPAGAGRRIGPPMVLHSLQHVPRRPGALVPQVQVRARDDVVSLVGELDMAVADEVEQVLYRVGEHLDDDGELRIDLRELEFLDLHGARTLARVARRLDVDGRRLVLSGARPPAERCLELFGLSGLFGLPGTHG
ncbi:MAG: MEDS domain-containing protein [Motilibacteraceae bacterium]